MNNLLKNIFLTLYFTFKIPGIHPKKTSGLSDLEKTILFDALQPLSTNCRSKARVLIDSTDIIYKSVLKRRLAPNDAALITFKILEVKDLTLSLNIFIVSYSDMNFGKIFL